MQSLKNYINESLICEGEAKTSLRDYLLWHFNANELEDITFAMFAQTDFDAKLLDKKFGGDKQAMYDVLMDVAKSDKPIKISSSWYGDNILTKFKADKYTFNVIATGKDSSWFPEFKFINKGGKDKDILNYNNQLIFKSYAMSRMEKDGLLSDEIKRSGKFRKYGLFSFDWTSGYDAYGPHQVNIPGLKLDKELTFDDAYDIVVKYFKKEKVLK